jgi:hypothetical protein
MGFDPQAHITQIRGNDYLEVKWRIVWFREKNLAEEGWGIETKIVKLGPDFAICRAEIVDPEGRVVATGTKSETKAGFEDFIEKAETGSIGRALALLGYGTQWCAGELAEGARIVDSPVGNGQQQAAPPEPAPPGEWLDDGRPADLEALAHALMQEGVSQKSVVPYAIRAGKSLGLEGKPPDWPGDVIADVYDEALKHYQADKRDAEEAQ